jgi:hypothetical protein
LTGELAQINLVSSETAITKRMDEMPNLIQLFKLKSKQLISLTSFF